MNIRLMLIMLFTCLCQVNAQVVKSYMQMEVLAPSSSRPITDCALDIGIWVEWNKDESKMVMMDGINWKYINTDMKEESHYKDIKSTLSTVPGTIFHEAVVS